MKNRILVTLIALTMSALADAEEDIFNTLDTLIATNEKNVTVAVDTFFTYSPEDFRKLYYDDVESKIPDGTIETL